MLRERSPNYPHISIEQAVRKAGSIYQALGTRSSSGEEMTRAMGHSGKHVRHLAALSAYALLQGRHQDLSLTPGAALIAELADQPRHPDRVTAIRAAAFSPEVFRGLRGRFGDGRVPPQPACYRWLLRRGFTHQGSNRASLIYQRNLRFLDALSGRGH